MKKENPYEKKEIVISNRSISHYDSNASGLKHLIEKIEKSIEKIKNDYSKKGSKTTSAVLSYYSFNGTVSVKRLETDSEYQRRIALHEKAEEQNRKKEEEKIKRDFKKLQELKAKYGDSQSPEEVIQKKRMQKANQLLGLPNN